MPQTKVFTFQIFGIPVRVDLYFFLMALILGSSRRNIGLIAIWVAVVFVSVLIHELGHALVSRKYGHTPWIELYTGGGLTHGVERASRSVLYWRDLKITRYDPFVENLAISLAGPAAGFIVGGIVWMGSQGLEGLHASLYLWVLVRDLIWVNIGWGILNLIPMLPLDGGNIMQTIIQKLRNDDDERLPLQISIGVGVMVAALALLNGFVWGVMLCAWFIYQNYQRLQHTSIY